MIIERGPGVEVKYRYGLLGTRGGGTGRRFVVELLLAKRSLILLSTILVSMAHFSHLDLSRTLS